jgi:hypothetical protein
MQIRGSVGQDVQVSLVVAAVAVSELSQIVRHAMMSYHDSFAVFCVK